MRRYIDSVKDITSYMLAVNIKRLESRGTYANKCLKKFTLEEMKEEQRRRDKKLKCKCGVFYREK